MQSMMTCRPAALMPHFLARPTQCTGPRAHHHSDSAHLGMPYSCTLMNSGTPTDAWCMRGVEACPCNAYSCEQGTLGDAVRPSAGLTVRVSGVQLGLPGTLDQPEAWATWYNILRAAAAPCPAAAPGGPWGPLHQMLAVACVRYLPAALPAV